MGMPRNPDNARHTTQIKLPADLLDRLDREAEARMLGRSKLIELLLRDAFARLRPVEAATADPTPPTETP